MANQSSTPAYDQEAYLYAYAYRLRNNRTIYHWPGYFKNYKEACTTAAFFDTDPDIEILSIIHCYEGLHWGKTYLPYKESDWKKKYNPFNYEEDTPLPVPQQRTTAIS